MRLWGWLPLEGCWGVDCDWMETRGSKEANASLSGEHPKRRAKVAALPSTSWVHWNHEPTRVMRWPGENEKMAGNCELPSTNTLRAPLLLRPSLGLPSGFSRFDSNFEDVNFLVTAVDCLYQLKKKIVELHRINRISSFYSQTRDIRFEAMTALKHTNPDAECSHQRVTKSESPFRLRSRR